MHNIFEFEQPQQGDLELEKRFWEWLRDYCPSLFDQAVYRMRRARELESQYERIGDGLEESLRFLHGELEMDRDLHQFSDDLENYRGIFNRTITNH